MAQVTINKFQVFKNVMNVIVFQAIAVVTVFAVWLGVTHSRKIEMTLHICFLTIGYCLLMSESIMLLSTDQFLGAGIARSKKSMIHGVFIGIGTVLCITGMSLEINSKNQRNSPHFTTAHGIAGLVSLILIITASVVGFLAANFGQISKYLHIPPVWWKIIHYVCGLLGYVAGMTALCLAFDTGIYKKFGTWEQRVSLITVTSIITAWSSLPTFVSMFTNVKNLIKG